jgi:hypothetical protein
VLGGESGDGLLDVTLGVAERPGDVEQVQRVDDHPRGLVVLERQVQVLGARLAEDVDAPAPGLGFTCIVQNIEYRGSSVKLSVSGAGIEDFTAIVRDTDFFAAPPKVGDAVPLAWTANDAIVLGKLH